MGWNPFFYIKRAEAERRKKNWKKLKSESRYTGNGWAMMYKMLTSFEIKAYQEKSEKMSDYRKCVQLS